MILRTTNKLSGSDFLRFSCERPEQCPARMEIAPAHGALEWTERIDERKLEVCFHNNAGSQNEGRGACFQRGAS